MNQKVTSSSLLIIAVYIGIALYNMAWFAGKFQPEVYTNITKPVIFTFHRHTILFNFLELLGIISLLVNLITKFDEQLKIVRFISAIVLITFSFCLAAKIFLSYFDEAYM